MSAPASSLDFYLEGLNQTLTMTVSGLIEDEALALPTDISATAILYMSQDDVQSIFKFQSDSVDVSNQLSSDVVFHIDSSAWSALGDDVNGVRAMMHDGSANNELNLPHGAANAKRLVKHDFVRYMAKQLFNTTAGVDLFNNEGELLGDLETKWDGCHSNIVTALSTANGKTSEDTDNSANVGLQMLQHIAASDPGRLVVSDNSGTIQDTSGVQPFPIVNGDSLNFKLAVTGPSGNQTILESVSGTKEIGTRTYLIKIYIGDTANTTSAHDTV